ncbi:hypothetical protein EDB85DRAFT_1425799 [Lactarius pseudohatsudake]|nr:hypothetical protein EDB85DRAFT_1425799 [Lactarius pseudohatsudake]
MTSHRTDIAYELPSTIKSFNDRWLATCRSSTVLAGRFAVVEVHLLSFVKNEANFDKSVGNNAMHALLISTYLTLFFFLGAVVSGLVLTYGFGEHPPRASQEGGSYGIKRTWVWVMWHWVFSLIAGMASLIIQVLLYVWLEEPNSVRITVSIITVFVVLPLVHIIPHPSGHSVVRR